MIRAAIFDMDGLLIDSEPMWRQAEIEVFRTVGLSLSDDDCRETMGYRLNEVVDLWHRRKPWKGKSKLEVENEIIERVGELIGLEGKLLPGVSETIAAMVDEGYKPAIASSSPMSLIRTVVERFGLEDRFEILHSAENEKYGKPHPDVFIHTAKKLGIKAESCVVFEDSFHGMIAALAAKMKVVVVPEKPEVRFGAAHLALDELDPKAIMSFLRGI
jgi:sugar-phosphatase